MPKITEKIKNTVGRVFTWQFYLGVVLVLLATAVYFIHYLIFRDVHHIFLYLIGDIAFVFFEVLLVTLIIHHLLASREKKAMVKKLNMVIGAFFSEVGTSLLKSFSEFDPCSFQIAERLVIKDDWDEKKFCAMRRHVHHHECIIETERGDLKALRSFLIEKRHFLLNLLENPNLLEHESFTNLLWAVFHLTEELASRKSLESLPDTDIEHLAKDVQRAYRRLIYEWLAYMRHLKKNYPYLFSLAMRTNPFDPHARVEVS